MRSPNRIGLVTLLDPRPEFLDNYREDFGQDAPDPSHAYKMFHSMICDVVTGTDAELIECGILDSYRQVVNAVTKILQKNVHALVIHIPGWTYPSWAAMAARMAHARSVPVLLWGSFALSGPTASKGAIDELEIPVKVLYGPPADESVTARARSFLRAAHTYKSLEGCRFGMFGGYSMGINTGAINPSRWLRLFGIDSDNTDQIEIVNRAATVEDELVREYAVWLENSFNRVVRDNRRVTDETIQRAIRSYIATKRIIAEREYDFVAVKCQPELSDGFVNQCLSQTLLNDPYDAEGHKDPICSSCEGDSNGALTMHILKHLSGGKPVLFADAVTFDDERNAIICQNCGGATTWFADANSEAPDKLKTVDIVPNVQGQAGGPAFNYYGTPVGDITWARLAQTGETYIMHIVKGEFIEVGEAFRHFLMKWPTVAVKTKEDTRTLMETYPSQHVHIVAADVVEELAEFCRIAGFSFEIHE